MAQSLTAARENLFIRKLKSLPGGMFKAVVAKLTAGETAAHVARWIVSQQPAVNRKVAQACWSEKTAEVYVGALRRKVQADIKKAKSIAPEPFVYRALLEEAKLAVKSGDVRLIDEEVRKSMKGLGEIFGVVQKQVLSMNAQTMLKYCFMIQQARVKKMRELEESLGMLFPEGYKNIQVLSDIASDIAKLEVGDLWMRGKNSLHHGSIAMNTGSETQREQGQIAKRVAELGEVDRNLIRIAGDKVIELIREEAKGGITTEPMEAHAGGIVEGKAENSSADNLQDDSGG